MSKSKLSKEETEVEQVESIRDGIYRTMAKGMARALRYKPSRRRGSRRAYKYFRRGLRLLTAESPDALACLFAAAKGGYADAQCVFGNLMMSSVGGYWQEETAKLALGDAAAQGHALAMVALADLIKADSPLEAFALCRRAAARDVRAVPFLAKMYLRGIGTDKDIDKARAVLERGWRKSPMAATLLALILRDSDPERSDALMHYAAVRGDAEACYQLSVQTDFPESDIWGAMACRLGSIRMLLEHAKDHYTPEMYRDYHPDNLESKKNFASVAWEYLSPAARMGSAEAERTIDELRKDDIPQYEADARIVIDPQTLRPVISVTPPFDHCIEQAIMFTLEDGMRDLSVFTRRAAL